MKGVCKHTIYAGKVEYGGIEMSQTQEAKQFRDENTKFRKLVADPRLDKEALQSGIRKDSSRSWPGRRLPYVPESSAQPITEYLTSADELRLVRCTLNGVVSRMRSSFSAVLLRQQPVNNYLCLSANKYLSVRYERDAELRGDSEGVA